MNNIDTSKITDIGMLDEQDCGFSKWSIGIDQSANVITYSASDRHMIENRCPKGWKFSVIDGDPDLGKNHHCYLTSHHSDPNMLLLNMKNVVAALEIPAIRQKIEKIVYDTKTDRNEIAPWHF